MYFQTILKRSDNEITKKVQNCQKANPVKGDWIELLRKDFTDIGMEMDEEKIKSETKMQYKSRVRKHLQNNMLKEMKKKQEGHTKIRDICYNNFNTQTYLTSHIFNNHETYLLFSLRSRNSKHFKANFPYNIDQICPMSGCTNMDTQEHCLDCEKNYPCNTINQNISYSDIYSIDITKQAAVNKLFAPGEERGCQCQLHWSPVLPRVSRGVQWSL